MNWMIYPAARAFIKVCAVLFRRGRNSSSPHPSVHAFFSSALPGQPRPSCFLGTGAELLSILSLSFLMFWGARVLLASRGKQDNKKSEHAGLPARPVRPPHSVCGHARLIAIYGNGQGLGGLPPSGDGWPFFCPAAWKSCWRPFPSFWRGACLKSCP